MSRHIFFVNECRLNIRLDADASTASAAPGGNMLNAALRLAAAGYDVSFVGEAATDYAGNAIVDRLARAGVDTDCIDRFPDGATTIDILAPGSADSDGCFYLRSPKERLVLKWPRINAGDILVAGNWFALSPRTREAVGELAAHAAQRKALVVYMPGFAPQLEPAITHVMPTILDYLELADIVVTFGPDCRNLFGINSAADCYGRKINFYADSMVHIEASRPGATLFLPDLGRAGADVEVEPGMTDADILASMIGSLASTDESFAPSANLLPKFLKRWKANR